VLAPVRIADVAAARLLEPGDVVDVLAVPAGRVRGGREAARVRVVARRARVAEVPAGAAAGGALLVLAVRPGTAAELAGAGAAGDLAVIWR
jgi:hypothetical protein